MRKLLIVPLFLTMIITSCTDETLSNIEEKVVEKNGEKTKEENQRLFTETLSKAVANNTNLRSFLKEEAIAKFDMDYDILYHKVKNKVVENNLSFRDILMSYLEADDMASFTKMERSSPLLTIYIPNLITITGFCAESWDIRNDQIGVSYESDKNQSIYENGEKIGSIEKGMIPDFPILFIKDNTKVYVTNFSETRSSNTDDFTYDFIRPVFNPQNYSSATRSNRNYTADLNHLNKYLEDGIDPMYIDQLVIDAYNENIKINRDSKYQYFAQRDYIYYGLTKENNKGEYRSNIHETIFRFRISPSAFVSIADDKRTSDPETGDPFLQEVIKYGGNDYNYHEMVQRLWAGGVFQINFQFFITNNSNDNKVSAAQMAVLKEIPVQPSQLFAIKRYNRDKRDKKPFRSRRFIYKVMDPKNDLVALWYYPTKNFDNVQLTRSQRVANSIEITNGWNLANTSTKFLVYVTEHDAKGSKVENINYKTTFVKNISSETNVSFPMDKESKVTSTNKFGYGTTDTEDKTISIQYTIETGEDLLGKEEYSYSTQIIKNIDKNKVYLNSLDMGGLNVCIVPQYKGSY